jgi:hypothetical protein
MATLVRIVGAVEALTALLIVFGDRIGGGLLFLYLAVYGVVQYLPNIMTAISKQKVNDLLSMLPQVFYYLLSLQPSSV